MWARRLAFGVLTTSALLGLTYALSQIEVVSFFPLDVAQAGVRLTPGAIATQGIEALGPGARMLAEASGLALVLVAGAAAGGIVLRFGVQRSWSNILPLEAGRRVAQDAARSASARSIWSRCSARCSARCALTPARLSSMS